MFRFGVLSFFAVLFFLEGLNLFSPSPIRLLRRHSLLFQYKREIEQFLHVSQIVADCRRSLLIFD